MNERFETAGMDRRGALGLALAGGLSALLAPSQLFAVPKRQFAPNLHAFAERWVAPGKLPGMVIGLGMPKQETRYITRGSQGFLDADVMAPDTLFRIYSMTKPVTGMATMALIDEGKLALDQPLADLLPAFARMQVQNTYDGALDDVRPAKTAITIRHLLTHTSGLAYGIIQKGPIRAALFDRGLIPGSVSRLPIPGLTRGKQVRGLAAFADGMAQLPLVHEPGTRWSYSSGLDILGRVIEVVTGQAFDLFLKQRFFDPLGMTSTGFRVAKADAARLATNYGVLAGRLVAIDPPESSIYLDEPPFPFGGAGLVSTPRDYDRFLRMIGGKGKLDGERVMSESAVAMATSNLLPPETPTGMIGGLQIDAFGAGGRVGMGAEAGIFGWSGAACTVGMVDMASGLTSSLYTQFMPLEALAVLSEFQQALRSDVRTLLENRR
jgi:CubicO group peptidase (beta-lactamase class C family)